MVQYKEIVEHEVVWHGAMQNDPLGGFTKGCLSAPREQTETERRRAKFDVHIDDDHDFTSVTWEEMDRAVRNLNASLKNPLKFNRELRVGGFIPQRGASRRDWQWRDGAGAAPKLGQAK